MLYWEYPLIRDKLIKFTFGIAQRVNSFAVALCDSDYAKSAHKADFDFLAYGPLLGYCHLPYCTAVKTYQPFSRCLATKIFYSKSLTIGKKRLYNLKLCICNLKFIVTG